jgi:ADP-ribosylglycohydrolase
MSAANEDAFIGSLLGLAIGDALGMPVAGLTAAAIGEQFGTVDGYMARTFEDGVEIAAGEFTDEAEFALCIAESMTTNGGFVDAETLGPRLLYLARGDSKRWLGDETRRALARAEESLAFEVALDEDGPATGDVAVRGVPIGLVHSVGALDSEALRADAERVTRITHGSPAAMAATVAVGYAVRLAARHEASPAEWLTATADFLGAGEVADALRRAAALPSDRGALAENLVALGTGAPASESVSAGLLVAARAESFEEAVVAAVNAGGQTDTVAAIAGAIKGAEVGAAGIPQRLIDGLGGRIYVSLAAPWLYRSAQRRAGRLIDLRFEGYGPSDPPPRPTMPPIR